MNISQGCLLLLFYPGATCSCKSFFLIGKKNLFKIYLFFLYYLLPQYDVEFAVVGEIVVGRGWVEVVVVAAVVVTGIQAVEQPVTSDVVSMHFKF